MAEERSITTCICRTGTKNGSDICFMATGFSISKTTINSVDIFISPTSIQQTITQLNTNNKAINLALHLMNSFPIKAVVPFETTNVKNATNLKDAMIDIFSDLIKHQPVVRDSILFQLQILLSGDTTVKEKLLVLDFLRGLDTFRYGKDTTKRFQTRCIALLTCIVVFFDDVLYADTITEFKEDMDIVTCALLEKIKERNIFPRFVETPSHTITNSTK